MSETGQPAMPDGDRRSSRSCGRKKAACLLSILVVALLLAIGISFCPWIVKMRASPSPDLGEIRQKLTEVELQIQAINGRLDDENARLGKETPGGAGAASGQDISPSAEIVARMQSDLTALSSAVNGLQAEVKQAGSSVAATQQAAQASMASAIAFIQLRAAAETGRGFAVELAALRAVAPDDGKFREVLDRLVPYADTGAPAIGVLREEFMNLETSASLASDKAGAQTWWQRVIAELKGLVSIRPLHGDGIGADAEGEQALAAGNLDIAIAAVKTRSPEAQDVFKDWLTKAQARVAIDTAIQDLSDRFVALANPSLAPNSRNEP